MGETFVQSARLSARMILLHPRYVDSSPCVFFDAKVVGDCSQEQPIWCSLRYRLIFPGQTIPYGVCDVVARVVNFEPNVHPLSVDHDEQEYHLLGDIFHISPIHHNFLHRSPPLAQPACARLTIICKLGYVLTDVDTFKISLSEVVQDAPERARLRVHAWPKHPGWLPIPLLFPNVMATISGTVQAFRHGVLLVHVDEIASWPPRPPVRHTVLAHEDMEAID